MELNARNACRRGERETADALGLRARDLMERSWRAYESAAWLSPEDARIVNDAGVILTYYLQRDPETAQRCFERAIELDRPACPSWRRRARPGNWRNCRRPSAMPSKTSVCCC